MVICTIVLPLLIFTLVDSDGCSAGSTELTTHTQLIYIRVGIYLAFSESYFLLECLYAVTT
jgi:hypothetical protein